jgi:thioredoxin reductase
LLKQRTDKEPNIKYLPNICLEDIREEFDYVLGAIGREPNFELVDDKIENAPNIYLIGDIKNGMRRQTAIAVGDGLRVAMDIYENNF